MKIYVRSDNVDWRALKESEDKVIDDTVEVLFSKIQKRFEDVTGFTVKLERYYYRHDLDSVLLRTMSGCGMWDQVYLTYYTSPGRAGRRNPAVISLDPSDDELNQYVSRMKDKMIDHIRYIFKSPYTITDSHDDPADYRLKSEDELDDDTVISSIVEDADWYVVNDNKAYRFIKSLLDSGQIINELPEMADKRNLF